MHLFLGNFLLYRFFHIGPSLPLKLLPPGTERLTRVHIGPAGVERHSRGGRGEGSCLEPLPRGGLLIGGRGREHCRSLLLLAIHLLLPLCPGGLVSHGELLRRGRERQSPGTGRHPSPPQQPLHFWDSPRYFLPLLEWQGCRQEFPYFMWGIYTMEYYSALKWGKSYHMWQICMNVEDIMPS